MLSSINSVRCKTRTGLNYSWNSLCFHTIRMSWFGRNQRVIGSNKVEEKTNWWCSQTIFDSTDFQEKNLNVIENFVEAVHWSSKKKLGCWAFCKIFPGAVDRFVYEMFYLCQSTSAYVPVAHFVLRCEAILLNEWKQLRVEWFSFHFFSPFSAQNLNLW